MNITELTYQQKFIAHIVIIVVVILILIKFTIYPIFLTSDTLERRITNEKSLNQYLQQSQQQLRKNKIFKKITTVNAKKIIKRKFNNIKNSIIVKDSKIIMTIKSQNFSHIINNIHYLKNNNGIVVVEANFTKQDEGIVNANLTFKHL